MHLYRLVTVLCVGLACASVLAVDFMNETFDTKVAGSNLDGQLVEGSPWGWDVQDLTNTTTLNVSTDVAHSGLNSLEYDVLNYPYSSTGQLPLLTVCGLGPTGNPGIPFDAANPVLTLSTHWWISSANLNTGYFIEIDSGGPSGPEVSGFYLAMDGIYMAVGFLSSAQAMSAPGTPLLFQPDAWNQFEMVLNRQSATSVQVQFKMNGQFLSGDGITPYSEMLTQSSGYKPSAFAMRSQTEGSGNAYAHAYVDDIRVSSSPVPEPLTVLAFAAGLPFLKRRRSK